MKIAGISTQLDCDFNVTNWLKEHQPDVLCLQETKTQDEHFPHEAIADAGWPHIAMRGEKSYNGVAILSRLPLSDISHMDWTGRPDCRHISASVGGLTIHNFTFRPVGTSQTGIKTGNSAISSIFWLR